MKPSTSSNLAPRELYRYDWRTDKFLEKFRNEKPFTMVDGTEVTFKHDPVIDALISYRSRLRIPLKSVDGKIYSLSNFAKTAEFGGGGGTSGGTVLTKLTESAQALYGQARMMHRISFALEHIPNRANLEAAYTIAAVIEPLDSIMTDLSDEWRKSCIIGAEVLNETFNDRFYQFHHKSDWVVALESVFKKLNSKERIFSNVNKWSPADIYMVSAAGGAINFSEANSIAELNKILVDAMNARDIIGISLKRLNDTAKVSFHNIGDEHKKHSLDRVSVGLTGFFSSKDTLIYFGEKDKIQFRTFPETFQGEIKGKNANHGKISYGPIQTILRLLNLPRLDCVNALRSRIAANDPALTDELYFMYRLHCHDTDICGIEEFTSKCREKGAAWLFSKFLGVQLVNNVVQFNKGDEFITACLRYASSSSEMSAPFAKLE